MQGPALPVWRPDAVLPGRRLQVGAVGALHLPSKQAAAAAAGAHSCWQVGTMTISFQTTNCHCRRVQASGRLRQPAADHGRRRPVRPHAPGRWGATGREYCSGCEAAMQHALPCPPIAPSTFHPQCAATRPDRCAACACRATTQPSAGLEGRPGSRGRVVQINSVPVCTSGRRLAHWGRGYATGEPILPPSPLHAHLVGLHGKDWQACCVPVLA